MIRARSLPEGCPSGCSRRVKEHVVRLSSVKPPKQRGQHNSVESCLSEDTETKRC